MQRMIPSYQELIRSETPIEVETSKFKQTLRGKLDTTNDIRTYVTAGKAIFTLQSNKSDQRFTYKITKPNTPMGKVKFFVKLLNGPNNTKDYKYLGHINLEQDILIYHLGKKSKITDQAPSHIAFRWFWEKLIQNNEQALQQIDVYHEGTCCRCGRTLTVPASVARGIGPECAVKMGMA